MNEITVCADCGERVFSMKIEGSSGITHRCVQCEHKWTVGY